MTVFILLTRGYDSKPMTINMDQVEAMIPQERGTTIRFSHGSSAEVTEDMQSIINMTRTEIWLNLTPP